MSLNDVQVHLVDSVDEAGNLMRWLSQYGKDSVIGCDTETGGLDKRKYKLRTVQIGDAVHGWTIPWDRWGGVFQEVTRKYEGFYVLHNAPFDTGFMDAAGVSIPRAKIHDTRPMAHILDPTYSTALKNLAAKHVDSRAGSMQGTLDDAIGSKGGWSWETIPVDYQPYWTYAALDPVLTFQLYEKLSKLVKEDGSERAYEIELAVQWVLERMQDNGIHVDTDLAHTKMDELTKYCEEVAQWVKTTYGVSPGSNQGIIDALVAEGFDFTKRTKSGAAALDKEVLSGIEHPLAHAVLSRRQLQKVASTYLSHFVGEADADGILHPSINPLGARTSRMSMSSPNLQNLPRQSEGNPAGNVVRQCVTTRYDGDGTMMFCDFAQVEMRMLAHMCGDPNLKQAFLSEGDFFVNLARQVFRDETIEKKDPRRQIVKNLGYAKIYGAGIAKLALTAGISEDQAAASMHAFDSSFPGVRQFQNIVQRTAMERKSAEGVGYVRSPLTRRRHPADSGKEYALVNFLIQGAAAETFKIKLLELDSAGLGDWMCLPVHDEVILDVPGEHVAEAANTLLKVMNDKEMLSVPIEADVSVGKSWGRKVAYEPTTVTN